MKVAVCAVAMFALIACLVNSEESYDVVTVNGQFVKRDNEATGVMAGLPIRYPVEDEGRHKPASTEQWLTVFTIDGGSLSC